MYNNNNNNNNNESCNDSQTQQIPTHQQQHRFSLPLGTTTTSTTSTTTTTTSPSSSNNTSTPTTPTTTPTSSSSSSHHHHNYILQQQQQQQNETNIGPILVSINPHQILPIYTQDILRVYKQRDGNRLPPHLFSIAEKAYMDMIDFHRNQVISISGESGSGKSENNKLIVQYLLATNPKHTAIENLILESGSILESFGHCSTVTNYNSSRWGKYFEIYYNYYGEIQGAKIYNYFLDESRVAFQNKGERNFHIFYQFFTGTTEEEKLMYGLSEINSYHYLSQGGTLSIDEVNDSLGFERLKMAFSFFDFPPTQIDLVFRTLSFIINLGNVTFYQTKNKVEIRDRSFIEFISNIISFDSMKLEHILLPPEKNVSIHEATENRDSLAKSLYSSLFHWIVDILNNRLAPPQYSHLIGILDLFGQENTLLNGYEQFSINFLEEQLQQIYTQTILKAEQEDYKKEKIPWNQPIPFKDNSESVELMEKIVNLLDQESKNVNSNDSIFLDKLNLFLGKHHLYFTKPKKFGVEHFFGTMFYDIKGFIQKNRDEIFQRSSALYKNSIIKYLFSNTSNNNQNQNQNQYNQQQQQQQQLTNDIIETKTSRKTPLSIIRVLPQVANFHFIRCLKPNSKKAPNQFDTKIINEQIKTSLLAEASKIQRLGYTINFKNKIFFERFSFFFQPQRSFANLLDKMKENGLQVEAILSPAIQIGSTKIFLRYTLGSLLEVERMKRRYRSAITIQKNWRMYRDRKHFNQMKKACITVQKCTRRWLVQRRYHSMKAAIVVLKSFAKMVVERTRFLRLKHASMLIQSHLRCNLARSYVSQLVSSEPNSTVISIPPSLLLPPESPPNGSPPTSPHSDWYKEDGQQAPQQQQSQQTPQQHHQQPPKTTERKSTIVRFNHEHRQGPNNSSIVPPLQIGSIKNNTLSTTSPTLSPVSSPTPSSNSESSPTESPSPSPSASPRRDSKYEPTESPRRFNLSHQYKQLQIHLNEQQQQQHQQEKASTLSSASNQNNIISTNPSPRYHSNSNVNVVAPFNKVKPSHPISSKKSSKSSSSTSPQLEPSSPKIPISPHPSPRDSNGTRKQLSPSSPSFLHFQAAKSQPKTSSSSSSAAAKSQKQEPPQVPIYKATSLQGTFKNGWIISNLNSPRRRSKSILVKESEAEEFLFLDYAKQNFELKAKKSLIRKKVVSHDTIISFSKKLATSLHKFTDQNLEKMALEIFSNILQYMGDIEKKKETMSYSQIASFIIRMGIQNVDLRDEIYCQIIKQITNHPGKRENRLRGWELLSLCCGSFAPKQRLLKYVSSFLLHRSANLDDDGFASACFARLQSISTLGPRALAPVAGEIEAVRRKSPVRLKFYFPDDVAEELDVESTTTAGEVADRLIKLAGLRSDAHIWSVYEVYKNKERSLRKSEFILDIESKWGDYYEALRDYNQQSGHNEDFTSFLFCFKIQLFLKPQKTPNKFESQFLFHQLLKSISKRHLPMTESEFIKLTALRIHYDTLCNNISQPLSSGDIWSRYIPEKLLFNHSAQVWGDMIMEKYQEYHSVLKSLTKDELRNIILTYIMALPFYGSTIFYDCNEDQWSEIETGAMEGFHVVVDTLKTFHYSRILECEVDSESKMVLSIDQEEMVILTQQSVEMVLLINSIIQHLSAESKCAVAQRDYTVPSESFSFKKGDIITNISKADDGWCTGTSNGVKGSFPLEFVHLIINAPNENAFNPPTSAPNVRNQKKSTSKSSKSDSTPSFTTKAVEVGSKHPLMPYAINRFRSIAQFRMGEALRHTSSQTDNYTFINDLPSEHQKELDFIFIEIMKYMGDYPLPPKEHKSRLLQNIIQRAINKVKIRDDIYFFICKQLTLNPNNEAIRKGMVLFSLCAGCFPASAELFPYLKEFLTKIDNPYSHYCIKKLQSTALKGQRLYAPSKKEIHAVKEKRQISCKIHLANGPIRIIEIGPSTTALEALKSLVDQLDLPYWKEFAIYKEWNGKEQCLKEHEKIADILKFFEEKEKKCKKAANGDSMIVGRFVLLRKIWIPHTSYSMSNGMLELMFYQYVHDVLAGKIPGLNKELALSLAALQLQAQEGDYNPDSPIITEDTVSLCIPATLIGRMELAEWVVCINQSHSQLASKSITPEKALTMYLEQSSSFPFSGTTWFQISQKRVQGSPIVWIGINQNFIVMFDEMMENELDRWDLEEVSGFTYRDDSFSFLVGNLINPTRKLFYTTQGDEINEIYEVFKSLPKIDLLELERRKERKRERKEKERRKAAAKAVSQQGSSNSNKSHPE
eukprot:gene1329-1675_t